MNWTITLVAAVVIVTFFALKRSSFVSAEVARKYLAEGALVIDVRSPNEFRGGRIPNAINIPLSELRESLPSHVKDKSQVLLLHCLSGTRSGIARRQLLGMGYCNTFNLGSYRRAEGILANR